MGQTAIKNAIHAWVMAASGYAGNRCIFTKQNGALPQQPPAGTYITIRIEGDWTALGIDEVQRTHDAGAPAGEEITHAVQGQREFSVSLQAFGANTDEDNGPRDVLLKVQAALGLPSRAAAFDAASISCFDSGSVGYLPEVKPAGFEARATLDCRFYATATASEKTGYIETVNATSYMGPPDSGTAENIDI